MSDHAFVDIRRQISDFRHFNRFYTRILGLLDEGLVQSKYSLTEARVIFELATAGEGSAKSIASELNLDSGYLSRILHKFEDAKILMRAPSAADARHSVLRLTKNGLAAFADLDQRANKQVDEMLKALTPAKRSALISSMKTIEQTFQAVESQPTPFILRSHRVGDMGWVVERHGILYAQEYGWDERFEGLVSQIVGEFISRFDARRERCWIAEREGERLGCVFVVRHPELEDTAKLRLLLVEPSARGQGLGKTLVRECVQFARLAGYKKMTLWTQSILVSAHRIYQQAGFVLAGEEPHHSFGKDLVGQTWTLDL